MKNILILLITILLIDNALACRDEIPIEVIKTDIWKNKHENEEYPIDYEIVVPLVFKSWKFSSVAMKIGESQFTLMNRPHENKDNKIILSFSATEEFIKTAKFEAIFLPYEKYYEEVNSGTPLCFYSQEIKLL